MSLLTFCESIAREEGWLKPDSLARRNHNPGNLRIGPFAYKHGALGVNHGMAIFPNDQMGFNAQSELLVLDYCGMTLSDAIYKYAPPTDGNNTEQYIARMEEWTGLKRTDILTKELLGPPVVPIV